MSALFLWADLTTWRKSMSCYQKKRKWVTLVEMMIVMFLIAMITAVIAYNYTGSLDEGKAFKTKTGMDKIRTILDLHLAVNPDDAEHMDTTWKQVVKNSQLVKGGDELLKDGWGVEYQVSNGKDNEIEIVSEKYLEYQQKKGKGSLFNQTK